VVFERAMLISERFCAGFALAATVARDRAAEQARRGLSAAIAPPLLATVQALSELSKAERRARVRSWMEVPRMRWPSEPGTPLRAYALLAQGEPLQTLPGWLRGAPLPRAGYKPPPELMALLRRANAITTSEPK
jgi:hypothetical protein